MAEKTSDRFDREPFMHHVRTGEHGELLLDAPVEIRTRRTLTFLASAGGTPKHSVSAEASESTFTITGRKTALMQTTNGGISAPSTPASMHPHAALLKAKEKNTSAARIGFPARTARTKATGHKKQLL